MIRFGIVASVVVCQMCLCVLCCSTVVPLFVVPLFVVARRPSSIDRRLQYLFLLRG